MIQIIPLLPFSNPTDFSGVVNFRARQEFIRRGSSSLTNPDSPTNGSPATLLTMTDNA